MNRMARLAGRLLNFARRPEQPDRDSLFTEIATREAAGVDLAGWLGVLPDPDPVLRKRGDDASVLDELCADDQVTMARAKRKLKTLNRQDYGFKPGAPKGEEASAEAERLCRDLVADLERLDLRGLFSEILDAPYFGYTVVELMFERAGTRLRLIDAVAKPRAWFGFDTHNRLVFRSQLSLQGELVPPLKFVLARHGATYANPYGERLLTRCLWPVAFKRGGIQFWMRFAEKYGQPWTVGNAPSGTDRPARQSMAADLARMTQDAVAVLPHGSEVKIYEASGKSADIHERLVRHWDAAISKVIMGNTLSAELGDSGSFAAAQTHAGELDDLAEADEALLVAAMNELAWNYARLNAPEGMFAPVFGFVQPEDHAARAELDTKLHGIGVRFRKSHFVRTYELAEEDFEIEEPVSQDEKPAPGPAFAAPGDADPGEAAAVEAQEALDRMVEGLLPKAVQASEERSRRIIGIIQAAESWEDLQARLAEAEPGLGGGEFEELLARALVAADAHGRLAAREENRDGR